MNKTRNLRKEVNMNKKKNNVDDDEDGEVENDYFHLCRLESFARSKSNE
jgi:hypothetical protein